MMIGVAGPDQVVGRNGERQLKIPRPLALAYRKRNAIPLNSVSIDPTAIGERLCAS